MSEEGQTPSVTEVIQSTTMEPLNNKIPPKADNSRHDRENEHIIWHLMGGFDKFLTTSDQVIRPHWLSILTSSIVCFIFRNEIVEISLVRNLFVLSFNAFAILLMFKLIKGDSAHQKTEVTKESLITKMSCELKSKSTEIEILKRYAVILNDELEANRLELDRYRRTLEVVSAGVKLEICNVRENLEVEMMNVINSKAQEAEGLKKESETLMATLKNEMESNIKEIERLKNESDAKTSELENDIVSKLAEIEQLKIILATTEVEWKSRLEDAVKSARMEENLMIRKITLQAEISKFTDDKLYSQSADLAGISWKMSARKSMLLDGVTFHLEAEHENAIEWSCPVIAEFRLISHKSKEIVHTRARNLICDPKHSSAYLEFISNKNLFDAEKGYVKDDAFIGTVSLRAFPSLDVPVEMTFRAEFTDISKLTIATVYSHPTEYAGWTLKIGAREDFCNDVTFYVEGKKESATGWWCPILAELRVISQKSEEIAVTKRKAIYEANDHDDFFVSIASKDLFDERNGIVNDDLIIVDLILRVLSAN